MKEAPALLERDQVVEENRFLKEIELFRLAYRHRKGGKDLVVLGCAC
jgi:hypothetical protein